MDFEDFEIDSAEQSVISSAVEETSLETVIQSEIQTEMPGMAPNPVSTATQPLSPLVWNISNMAVTAPLVTGNTLFEGIMRGNPLAYSDLSQEFSRKWRFNFETILGPANPAFIDVTLSDQDITDGFKLEYNPNGILWRVNAAGIPHPDDYDRFIEQNRVIENTTHHTVAEVQSISLSGAEISSSSASEVNDIKTTLPYGINKNNESIILHEEKIDGNKRYVQIVPVVPANKKLEEEIEKEISDENKKYFRTPDAAAAHFGKHNNRRSIDKNKEYWAIIHETKVGGKCWYTYDDVQEGAETECVVPLRPQGYEYAALVHTHGPYGRDKLGDEFSGDDKERVTKSGYNAVYAVTPNGSLLRYEKLKATLISRKMPDDEHDPESPDYKRGYFDKDGTYHF